MKVYRPKRLVFVRHAKSLWNAAENNQDKKKFRGSVIPPELEGVPDWDVPLSPDGVQQAIKTGEALASIFGKFETIYHSPLKRTTQTTRLIVEQFDPSVIEVMRSRTFRHLDLVEQNFGELDAGINNTLEAQAAYEDFYKKRNRLGATGKFWLRPPNGESWCDVCRRTHQFLDTIFRPNRHGQDLLVITHSVTKQTFRYHLERLHENELVVEYQRNKNKNCGVSCYEWNENIGSHGRYELKFWNQVFY